MLHIVLGAFNGFCFFQLPQSAQGVQLRQSTIFNFIFVATGVTAQQQPYFAERRRLYEEKEGEKSMYGNLALTCGLVVPELPYLCLCALLYFACWYYTVGLNGDAERTGAIFFTMLLYEFLYTSVGQLIMACVSDVTTATLLNPLILGNFVAF
jgi:ABC-type multidrug transport system permease subunit